MNRVTRTGSRIVCVGLSATTMAIAGLVGMAPTALAQQDDSAQAVSTEAAVQAVLPASASATPLADNARTDQVGQALATHGADASVSVPISAAQGVVITAADGSQLTLGLPISATADTAQVVDGSTVVYTDALPDVSVAVQPLQGGAVRALVAIEGANAPVDYRFPMQLPVGGSMRIAPTRAVEILDAVGATVGLIEPAWANDANGVAVRTSYRLDGDVLVQRVNHRGAAYPVVADPQVSFGWKVYVRYSQSEVRSIVRGLIGRTVGKIKYVALLCSFIPHPVIAAGCGLYVFEVFNSVSALFSKAQSQGKCVEMGYWYSGTLVSWKAYSC